jgi:hypothetical protein
MTLPDSQPLNAKVMALFMIHASGLALALTHEFNLIKKPWVIDWMEVGNQIKSRVNGWGSKISEKLPSCKEGIGQSLKL